MRKGKALTVYLNEKVAKDFHKYCAIHEQNKSKAVEEMIINYMKDYHKNYSNELLEKRKEIGENINELVQQLIKETYKEDILPIKSEDKFQEIPSFDDEELPFN